MNAAPTVILRRTALAPLLAVAALATASIAGPRPAAALEYATADDDASASESYREGQRALAEERWSDAARLFGAIAAARGAETDAALYWKAYADWKRQGKKDALEGLRQLVSAFPDSAWVDDARALELEIRGGRASERRAPEGVEDEELKLYALDALMHTDPEKAVPVLERILAGRQSLELKKRALFVLSQSDSPRAREILLRAARTGEPIELRVEAVRSLGIAGEEEDIATLAQIARDNAAPREVREAVLEAYLIAGREVELATLARNEPDPEMRRKAIELLGAMGALPALRELWSAEKDPEVRHKLLEAFGIAGDVVILARAARDPDPDVRHKAIEGLAIADSPDANRALRDLYGALSDPGDRRKVLEAFMIQGDAETLIELFRTEKDPQLRKMIVQQLAMLDDPKATELLMSLLEDEK